MIGTTDLDARRGIIWDMGRIASYGSPEALDLFVNIMVASAAIPGAFPPTLFDVEADGKPYQEMHVYGGAIAQVFVYPSAIHVKEEAAAAGFTRERRLYVIRNARLDPDWAHVERKTMSIAQRAIASLIHTQGMETSTGFTQLPSATASISTWRSSRPVSTLRTRSSSTPSICASFTRWVMPWR